MVWFATSDLHYDPHAEDRHAVQSLAAHVVAEGTPSDVLLLAGDYGNTDDTVRACLRRFAGFRGRRFAVAGNHDVWTDDPARDSWERYRNLSRIFREEGFHPLEDEPYIDDDGTAFIGRMGWYDYSFREGSLGYPAEAYAGKCDPGTGKLVWRDALLVHWPFTDGEMTEYQLELLHRHLEATAKATSRVVLMHHLPTTDLLMQPRFLVPRRWKVANTFLGSTRFGDLIESHADIPTVVLNGHSHMAKKACRNGVTYLSIGVGQRTRELLVSDGTTVHRRTFS